MGRPAHSAGEQVKRPRPHGPFPSSPLKGHGAVDDPLTMSDVMVIDANDDSIAMLGWYLSLYGHQVRRAASVAEAFDQIADQAPDALIIDLDMPGMSGHEFLSSLRRQGLAADAQVVMLGEAADARAAIRSWELGVDDHIVRPVQLERIADAIARQPVGIG